MNTSRDFYRILAAHRDCRIHHLNLAENLSREDVEYATEPEIVSIRRMVSEVCSEIHRLRGFVRLSPLGDFVLYGFMKPRHNIGERVCRLLSRRFPGTIIVLGNRYKSWISLYRDGVFHSIEGNSLNGTLDKLKSLLGCAESNTAVEDLWETYYRSQYCPERRNLKRFHRFMPRKYLKAAGLRLEGNKNYSTLNDFII